MSKKEAILGIFAVIGVITGIFMLGALVIALIYGVGYGVGWFAHLMIGPDVVFGLPFEQFIAILSVIGSIIAGGKFTDGNIKEKDTIIKQLKDELKTIRGY